MVGFKKKIGLANKIFIGMIAGLIIGFIAPGFGISLQPVGMVFKPGTGIILDTASEVSKTQTMSGFWDTVSSFIPANIFSAMAKGSLPQVILFAVFTGIAILLIGGDTKTRLIGAFHDISTLMLKIIMMVMELAPYGIAALMAWTAGKFGADIFGPFARFFGSVYMALFLQVMIVYMSVVFFFVRVSPLAFLKKVKPVWLTAFTLCSSAATIPVSLRAALVSTSEKLFDTRTSKQWE